MIRKFFCLLSVFVLFLFSGCTPVASEPVLPTESIPAAETEVATVPTEPAVIYDEGPGITVDGAPLSGSVWIDDILYVPVCEFLHGIDDGQVTGTEGFGYVLSLQDRQYLFWSKSLTFATDEVPALHTASLARYRDVLWMPLEEICGYMNISLLSDEEMNHIYCTSGIIGWDYPTGISIPVLMYHAVDDNVWGYADLFISPETMESHLQYLTENGFDLIHFEDLKNLDQYDKPVILTVDDGYLDNYTNLYPLLQKYNAKATIFVVTSSIGHLGTSMTPEQVKELADSELVSIQSHTVSHLVLRTLDDARQTEEMVRSKLEVARLSGREPFVVSYPTGQYNLYTLQTAAEHYRFAVIVEPETYITGSDPVRICRYNIRPTTTLENLATMVADAGKVSE